MKTDQNISKQKCQWILMWEDNKWWILFYFLFFCRKRYYPLLASFSLHKKLINGLERCNSPVSFWWHPLTAEDPFVSRWCNAKVLQICSDKVTNSSTSLNFEQLNYSFNYGQVSACLQEIQKNKMNFVQRNKLFAILKKHRCFHPTSFDPWHSLSPN